ncbi:MAG: DEAD/DEAH box helicase [Pseudohongiellaceae bacterium]
MSYLKFVESSGAFVWTGPELSDAARVARESGFVLSRAPSVKKRVAPGEALYFAHHAFSAIALMRNTEVQCCPLTVERTASFMEDYEASYETDSTYWPPSPDGCVYLPYQRAGIDFALGRQHTLIADQPGLGKTIQAIGFCNALIDAPTRVLVVCPAAVRINWAREIYKWSTTIRKQQHLIWTIESREDGVNPFAVFNIISYNLLTNDRIHQTIMGLDWDVLVLDEAHYLKTPHAQRTRAVMDGVAAKSGRILALTGTPLPNRPREAWTLAKLLCWDAIDWMAFEPFQSRYNPTNEMPNGYQLEEHFNLLELQSRMRCNYMVRRMKSDVLHDLPDKWFELSYIDPKANGPAVRRALRKEKMLDFSLDDLMNPNPQIMGQISTVRREMGEAMVPGMMKHIEMLLDGGVEKLVVFAHHRSVMDELMERMGQLDISAVRLSGSTPKAQRQNAIDDFQADPTVQVFLGQLTAAGVGITLTAASHVLLAEASWVPGENEQAVDRCHRIGQKNSVLAQYLVVEGSISEKIMSRAIEKHHVIHSTLDRGV